MQIDLCEGQCWKEKTYTMDVTVPVSQYKILPDPFKGATHQEHTGDANIWIRRPHHSHRTTLRNSQQRLYSMRQGNIIHSLFGYKFPEPKTYNLYNILFKGKIC